MPMRPLAAEKSELLARLDKTAEWMRAQCSMRPEIALVLGTGLGKLGSKMKVATDIPYSEIPNFPNLAGGSHPQGRLLLGTLGSKAAAILQGRFHLYEGYSPAEAVFPIRALAHLGARVLIVTNAAGGINPAYRQGDLVLIEDQMNLMGCSPLAGSNDERVGPRFPDMSRPYSARLAGAAFEASRSCGISLQRGVYAGVLGPQLETRAEYRMLRTLGADLVGMSTVPEVIAAVHMKMEVLGISVVTDICDPDHLEPVDIKQIVKIANASGVKMDKLLEAVLKKI
ncbi:MAG: purine-nucleoside phosphorylase [Candidatus Omnitrophica bacterium]|nr:purine-nucleoside phosphorylase [Candidatus Omnitrophota bacterium]